MKNDKGSVERCSSVFELWIASAVKKVAQEFFHYKARKHSSVELATSTFDMKGKPLDIRFPVDNRTKNFAILNSVIFPHAQLELIPEISF